MEFLFRSRSPGKRQVKPSQDIALLEDQLPPDESSDDSEYKVEGEDDDDDKSDGDNSSSSGNSSDSSSDNGDDDDDDGDGGDGKNELKALRKGLSTRELLAMAESSSALAGNAADDPAIKPVYVCGCCLGQSSTDANEIVECDGCGISVHEGCYGVCESTSVASTISSASTEPWFCEPCRAGLAEPPACELCPFVGGLYKETDIGRWVHLVCALYTPGVAFGDPDKLTYVTIFEMNYAQWGRRKCLLCEETRLARSGVCIQCDAGMCKSYFHATCAQAHGLLSEPSFNHDHDQDPYLAHCKIHTDKTVIRRRKQSFLTHLVQAKRRQRAIRDRNERTTISGVKREPDESADQRILRKLARLQNRFRSDKLKRHASWIPTQKIPRQLTTSSSAVRQLQRMGEVKGIDVERQKLQERQILSVMDVKKKWHIPPTFNVEYVAYYHDRQSRIEELKKKLSEQLQQQASLREQEKMLRPKLDQVVRNHETSRDTNHEKRADAECFRAVLAALCPGKTLPDAEVLKPLPRVLDIVTPNVKARATVWSNGGVGGASALLASANTSFLTSSSKKLSSTSKAAESAAASSSVVSNRSVSLKNCGICQRTNDQHLLVHCDTCRLDYHLGCLNPPLTRMPKKSRLYGWQCSECDKDTSGEEEMDRQSLEAPRKKRQAAARARVATSRANSDLEEFQDMEWDLHQKYSMSNGRGGSKASNVTPKNENKSTSDSKSTPVVTPGNMPKPVLPAPDATRTTSPAFSAALPTMPLLPPSTTPTNVIPAAIAGLCHPLPPAQIMNANSQYNVKLPPHTQPQPQLLQQQHMQSQPTPAAAAPATDVKDAATRQGLIDKAALKAERKREKREERARRKAEKRKKKEEKRKKRARSKEFDEADDEDEDEEEEEEAAAAEEEENEVEIIEDESGQCTVRIKPKPIKLKIKGLTPATAVSAESQPQNPLPVTNGLGSPVPTDVAALNHSQASPNTPPSGQPRKRAKRSSSGRASKDVRTHCDVCDSDGTNDNLVRCDDCRKCFHFTCLQPPVRKSPKVAGYSWHCNECDPSEVDSDWHLD